MGTTSPPVTVTAATLAGGDNNQDRYVIGDNFAIVLDGATSIAGDRSHDPGWFAEQLGNAITEHINGPHTLPQVVEHAIRAVRDRHHLTPESSPTSTVAIARWADDVIETYVLGDSTVALLMTDGSEAVRTDTRLSAVAPDIRAAYRDRLAHGHGYDQTHHQILASMQDHQAKRRNTPEGYWIAGAEPSAGRHGMTTREHLRNVQAVALASDGVAPRRHPQGLTWTHLQRTAENLGAAEVLARLHAIEDTDPDGQQWPRSKRHDDKTLVVVTLTAPDSTLGENFPY